MHRVTQSRPRTMRIMSLRTEFINKLFTSTYTSDRRTTSAFRSSTSPRAWLFNKRSKYASWKALSQPSIFRSTCRVHLLYACIYPPHLCVCYATLQATDASSGFSSLFGGALDSCLWLIYTGTYIKHCAVLLLSLLLNIAFVNGKSCYYFDR